MQKKQQEEKEVALTDEELDGVAGGANPFADKPRTPDHDYDEETKNKV